MKRFILILSAIAFPLFAQNVLTIDATQGKHRISKHIYGHFAEHLGGCIYGGIWVGPNSKIPNIQGYRKDVFEALKVLEIPVLRWPGGCYADSYHWKNGIGPREKRPKTKNVWWGGVIEDNSFGTHEFLNFCEMLGCDPYVAVNVGSGSIVEMIEWIQYMTSNEDIPMANLRRANERKDPWHVPFIGIGNENWGCGGNMTPEYYADLFKNYATYARQYGGNQLKLVACGSGGEDFNWTKVVMEKAYPLMDHISLHYYTIAGEGWHAKSSATDFGEALYFNGLKKASEIESIIAGHSAILDKIDPKKKIGLLVDEWGIWTDVEPGTNPAFLFQQNSMRDALIASLTFDIFNKRCDRVQMANIAQTVNVLQAVILTQGNRMIKTPTYYAFELYKKHKQSLLLPGTLSCEFYEYNGQSMPALSHTASLTENGTIFLTVSNANPHHSIPLKVELTGKEIHKVLNARVLTAPQFNSVNTFDNPDVVKPMEFQAYKIAENHVLQLEVPSKSIVAIELE